MIHFEGNDWWLEYEEGIRHYSKEALNKVVFTPAFLTEWDCSSNVARATFCKSFKQQSNLRACGCLHQKALGDRFIEKKKKHEFKVIVTLLIVKCILSLCTANVLKTKISENAV